MKSGEAKSGKPIMSQAITFNLPDELAERVRQLADQSRQSLEEVLVALVERATDDPPLEILSDEQVLALADLQLRVLEVQHDRPSRGRHLGANRTARPATVLRQSHECRSGRYPRAPQSHRLARDAA